MSTARLESPLDLKRLSVAAALFATGARTIRADIISMKRNRGGEQRDCMPPLAVGIRANDPDWHRMLNDIVLDAEQCPVVDFDPLGPVAPGFVTFATHSADLSQKWRDQMLGRVDPGESLAEVCGAAVPARPARPWDDQFYLVNPDEPSYRDAWFPVASAPATSARIHDGAPSCDRLGQPDRAGYLCLFGRIALQPDHSRPIVMAHGLFDSSQQQYVRNLGAVVYAMGFSVALLDMRDHGNTLRAAPDVGTWLGIREGYDLVSVARQLRLQCGVAHVGLVGTSGGAGMAVKAYAVDADGELDLGILAISPLVDPQDAIDRLSRAGSACSISEAADVGLGKIDWQTYVAAGAIGGVAAFFSLDEVDDRWDEDRRFDDRTYALWAAGGALGAMVGLGIVDAIPDGSSGCMPQAPIAILFKQLMERRWSALGLAGIAILDAYPATRSTGLTRDVFREHADKLPDRVRVAATAKRDHDVRSRLVLITSADAPVVSARTVARFVDDPAIGVARLTTAHGGYASFAIMHPVFARRFMHVFLCTGPWSCPQPDRDGDGVEDDRDW